MRSNRNYTACSTPDPSDLEELEATPLLTNALVGPREDSPPGMDISNHYPGISNSRLHDRRHTLIPPDGLPGFHGAHSLDSKIHILHANQHNPLAPSYEEQATLTKKPSFVEKNFLGLPSWDEPGREPGIEDLYGEFELPPGTANVRICVYDYSPKALSVEEVLPTNLLKFLAKERAHPVRWIRVDGLDKYVVKILAKVYGFNNLQMEDVFQVPQRPKVDFYPDNVFTIMNVVRPGTAVGPNKLRVEQISMFLNRDTVITVCENPPEHEESPRERHYDKHQRERERTEPDVWRLVKERIYDPTLSLRKNDASFLAYALMDAIVDYYFPTLEQYQAAMERADDDVVESPSPQLIRRIHGLERELMIIRRIMLPMKDIVDKMQKTDHSCVTSLTKTYLQDVKDHAVQILDIIENFRDFGSRTRELAMSMISHKLNEVMKVLTMISTVFIPLSFICGIYGMNFDNMPELHTEYGYAGFWVISSTVACAMLYYFHKKDWL